MEMPAHVVCNAKSIFPGSSRSQVSDRELRIQLQSEKRPQKWAPEFEPVFGASEF